MNLYEKLIEIRKCVPYLKKDTKGYQYEYVAGSSVLGAIKTKMDDLGVLLHPSLPQINITSGKEHVLNGIGSMTWLNSESPEEQIVVPWFFGGQDADISKAFGKALTYSERYFLLKFFNIATDKDDPDAFQKKIIPVQVKSAQQSGKQPEYSEYTRAQWNCMAAIATPLKIDLKALVEWVAGAYGISPKHIDIFKALDTAEKMAGALFAMENEKAK